MFIGAVPLFSKIIVRPGLAVLTFWSKKEAPAG
jgi:hypothetical protein